MGTFIDWPVACKLCDWHGYESGVRDHMKSNHPKEYSAALQKQRERERQIRETRKARSWLWRLWYLGTE